MAQKPSKATVNTVRDQQGRQRFHGAFTGGFSAGYFNTVGSAEGFKPAQFVSSRSNRAAQVQRSAKDFMDEEDGLLGGSLMTKQELDSFKDQGDVKDSKQTLSAGDRLIMEHFILQPPNTIGKKLLGLLGWKPGIAIGPRKKKNELITNAFSANLPSMAVEEGFVTIAPRFHSSSSSDALPLSKGDTTGLGYNESLGEKDFLRRDSAHSQEANRYHVNNLFRQGNKGTEIGSTYLQNDADDAEDIAYDQPQQRNARFSMEVEDEDEQEVEERDNTFKQKTSNLQSRMSATHLERCPSDNRPPLSGFHVATATKQIKVIHYPPPQVPREFKAYHLFVTPVPLEQPATINRKSRFGAIKTLTYRQDMLEGVKPTDAGSVFSLLRQEDRQRILALAANLSGTPQEPPIAAKEPKEVEEDKRPLLISSSIAQSKFAALSESFKNRFATSTSSSSSSSTSAEPGTKGGITAITDLPVEKRAVESNQVKMGRPKGIRRSTVVWAPSTLLCKRNNIKAPDHAAVYQPGKSEDITTVNPEKSHPENTVAGKDVLFQRLFQPLSNEQTDPSTTTSSSSTSFPAGMQLNAEQQQRFDAQDVYQSTAPPPPIEVFRSIFAESDSDSDNEDKEEEKEEEEEDREGKMDIAQPMILVAYQEPGGEKKEEKGNEEDEDGKEAIEKRPSLPTFIPKNKRFTISTSSSSSSSAHHPFLPSNKTSKPFLSSALSMTAEEEEEGGEYDLPDPTPATSFLKGQVKSHKRLFVEDEADKNEEAEKDQERKKETQSLKRRNMSGNLNKTQPDSKKKRIKLSFGEEEEEEGKQ